MAAIQIAHHLKVEVIATAGSAVKRLLETLGVKHVIDSRRADFAETIMDCRPRRRCRFEFARRRSDSDGTFLLGGIGRFIEIGKRDIYQNTRSGRCAKCLLSRCGHGRGL